MKSKLQTLVIMTVLLAGCARLNSDLPNQAQARPKELVSASNALAAGDFYLAKTKTGIFLKKNPNHPQAESLMAEILSAEIAAHKEAFDVNAAEEISALDKSSKIKTWLEQSRALLEMGEYDEATRTAENIFTLDPENAEASNLLDRIKKAAWTEGKKEIMDGGEIVRAEVDDRTVIYRSQAKKYISAGQWGAARLTVEKWLLLHPEDGDALKLLDEIKSELQSRQDQALQTGRSESRIS